MHRQVLTGLAVILGAAYATNAAVTPLERYIANGSPGNGFLATTGSGTEYYYGNATLNTTTYGYLQGGVSPNRPSLSWHRYVSDGISPVIFDLVGSTFNFGSWGGRDGELALFDSAGNLVASSQGVYVPVGGDSNVQPTRPDGAPLPGATGTYSQPEDPTRSVAEWVWNGDQTDGNWSNRNVQGLPQLAFVVNPESHPLWSTGSSDPAVHDAPWNQYGLLPAGEYFLAVTGYSTYFAGQDRDKAAIDNAAASPSYTGYASDDPFGFLSYHAHTGDYYLHTRLAGDFNQDGAIDTDDLALLQQLVADLEPYDGITPDGFFGDQWAGLPFALAAYDLTGNSRIDHYDIDAFARYTGIPIPEPAALAWLSIGLAAFHRRRKVID